ncbi:unnamed protein product [Somion occarium]|uniref:F-box domain-containing protein n=1 Tax=Somion occarium TaxID=3059160 RepID=A0ABP1E223_9APHY
MAPVILPQELIEMIVDQLHTSFNSLLSCHLVSHSFLHRARYHVWSLVNIDKINQYSLYFERTACDASAFAKLLQSSECVLGKEYALGSSIKSLNIHTHFFGFPVLDVHQFGRLLEWLPSLRSIFISNVRISSSPSPSDPVGAIGEPDPGIRKRHAIHTLELHNIFSNTSRDICMLIALFSTIRSIVFHDAAPPSKRQESSLDDALDLSVSTAAPRTQADELFLGLGFPPEQISLVLGALSLKDIRSVTLRCPLTFDEACPLLDAIAPVVQHLSIRPKYIKDSSNTNWPLPAFIRLRSLSIRLYFVNANDRYERTRLWEIAVSIISSVAASASPLLETLTFELGSHYRGIDIVKCAPRRKISESVLQLTAAQASERRLTSLSVHWAVLYSRNENEADDSGRRRRIAENELNAVLHEGGPRVFVRF